jgi:glycosyltransferase involved in cell wall biosynthesis
VASLTGASSSRTSPGSRLSVAHVITTLNVGGAETLLLELCRRLPALGVDCSVTFLKGAGPLAGAFHAAGVEVARVGLAAPVDPSALPRLRRKIAGFAPDVVHTHMFKADLHGLLAARLAGVKHIVTTKHAAEEARSSAVVSGVDRWLATRSDAVICVSEDMRAFSAQREGIPREHMTVIRSGIDVERFARPRDRGAARRQLGIGPGTPTVLVTSRLHSSKGHDSLIEAMRTVRAARPDAVLLVAGDGAERVRLERLAAPDGGAVRFLGTRSDVEDLLWAADLFVLPSNREALGLSLVEAMAARRPCVATRVGGVPEVVRDGENGLLVQPGDADALAGAITRILDDPVLAGRLAERGAEVARADFDIRDTVLAYAELYRRVAGANPH